MRPGYSRCLLLIISLLALAACGGGGGGSATNPPTTPSTPSLKTQTISFSETGTIELFVGDVLSTSASTPGSGEIIFSAEDAGIVSVDTNGTLTALSAGETTLNLSAPADSSYQSASLTIPVKVSKRQTSLTLGTSTIVLEVDGNFPLQPTTNSDSSVAFSVADTDIAQVSDTGVLTALKPGKTEVFISTQETDTYSAMQISATLDITLINPQLTLENGAQIDGFVQAMLSNKATSASPGSISYQSANDAIATVDQQGMVTLHSAGNTKVTVTQNAFGKYAASVLEFTVNAKLNPQTIAFANAGPMTLTLDDIITNEATREGTGTISYSSSNPSVASIDQQGSILALSAGSSVIAATVAADNFYAAATTDFTLTVERKAQTLEFQQQQVKTLVGKQLTYQASGAQGSGEISYASDNPSVATVTANGTVTVLAAGQANISAYIDADSTYESASTSYQLQAIPNVVEYRSWSGPNSAEVHFSTDANGLGVGASGDQICSYEDAAVCLFGSKHTLDGTPIEVPSLKAHARAYLNFKFGDYAASTSNSSFHWPARRMTKTLVSDGTLYLIGGRLKTGDINDVWFSADGISWDRRMKFLGGFSPDGYHAIASKNGNLYVYGGAYSEAIWKSTDQGSNWAKIVTTAAYGRRLLPSVVELGDDLYLLGGSDAGNNPVQDVWQSSDGENWAPVTNTVIFPAKAIATVFDNKIWILGSNGNSVNIQSSANGADWTSHNNNASFTVTAGISSLTAHNGKLWLLEGSSNQVWSSPDGSNWSREADLPYNNLMGASAVSYKGQLMVYGGAIDAETNITELTLRHAQGSWQQVAGHHYGVPVRTRLLSDGSQFWSVANSKGASTQTHKSVDGTHWEFVADAPENDENTTPVMFGNTPWIIANNHQDGAKSHYLDGAGNWIAVEETPAFSSRWSTTIIAKDNKLWLFGGRVPGTSTLLDDIWSSSDGIHWHFEGNFAALARTQTTMTVFKDAFWLVGGQANSVHYDEVYTSADGANWTLALENAPYGYRLNSGLFSFDNKLWLVGGFRNTGFLWLYQDIWSTEDGINWSKAADSSSMGNMMTPSIAVAGDTVLLSVGSSQQDGRSYGLWRSKDGVTWSRYTQQKVFLE